MISEKGEVLIRGPMVSTDNPEEWFATGDLGSLDADGWLTLTGRSKEIINRGGEVVGPLEVEDACLRHPAVAECVCFAVPHEARRGARLCIVPHSTRPCRRRAPPVPGPPRGRQAAATWCHDVVNWSDGQAAPRRFG